VLESDICGAIFAGALREAAIIALTFDLWDKVGGDTLI
jgi:hypothetical protein